MLKKKLEVNGVKSSCVHVASAMMEWRAQGKGGCGFGWSGGVKTKISSQSRDDFGDRSDKI